LPSALRRVVDLVRGGKTGQFAAEVDLSVDPEGCGPGFRLSSVADVRRIGEVVPNLLKSGSFKNRSGTF
jgi:hypothetical protein